MNETPSLFSMVRVYQFLSSLFERDRRVNHDNECDSPLLSFERMILVGGKLHRDRLCGIGYVLYTRQSLFSWMIPIELLNLQETGPSLQRWSKWFSDTLVNGEKMIEQVNIFRNDICDGKRETYSRNCLIGQGKYVANPYQIWWRPLEYIFKNSDHIELEARYDGIAKIVEEAGGEIPATGLTTLKRIWLIGCEREEQHLLPDTPYKELKEYLTSGRSEQLTEWAKQIDGLASVGQFHSYLRTVIANFQLDNCDEKVAQLELALEPQLGPLFANTDKNHQWWVKEIKGGWPVLVKGTKLHYAESLTDCVHRFKSSDDEEERLLVFGEKNGAECYLAQARREEGSIHYVPKGFGVPFFEIDEVQLIDWENPPDNLVDVLQELKHAMPRNIAKALRVDGDKNACWLPTEDRVPFEPNAVKVFLYENAKGKAQALIEKLDYVPRK